jgi:ABC-type transporter Mla subunit MlaD
VSQLGSVPADVLVAAVEKLVAKLDERDLFGVYERGLPAMSPDAFRAFTEAMFEAFRERGESSEDVAEGAGTTIERIAARDREAVDALVRYAHANSGVLKETTTLFVEHRPELVMALPATLYGAIEQRLSAAT